MTDRKFRFAAVVGLAPNARVWTATARRAEELGFSGVLIPDTFNTFEPFTALAAAATATTALRVGTFVLPAPFYAPSEVSWKAISLDLLSGGRFDLGLGAGRPGAEAEVGGRERAFGSAPERIGQLIRMIRIVKEDFAASAANERTMLRPVQRPHPPILVAAAGRRMFELAAQEADTVTLGLPPESGEELLAEKAKELADIAGDRFDGLELAHNLAAVGDEYPDDLRFQVRADPRELVAAGATSILAGTTEQMIDTLRRRRDTLGISYISLNAQFMEQAAPLIEALAGT